MKKGSNNRSPYKFVLSLPDIHQEAFLPQRNVILSTFQKPTHYFPNNQVMFIVLNESVTTLEIPFKPLQCYFYADTILEITEDNFVALRREEECEETTRTLGAYSVGDP